MTNMEYMRSLDAEAFGRALCLLFEDCNECYVRDKCHLGDNGFVRWLKEEHNDQEK